LAELRVAQTQGLRAIACAKYFILNDGYWSYYVSGFDGSDELYGLEVTPDGSAFASFYLSELANVTACLETSIARDDAFRPIVLGEIVQRNQFTTNRR
jgi:hypothetical protein